MKNKLLSLAVAVLGTPILAFAATPTAAPEGLCAHAAQWLVTFLTSLGLC